nr:hypothetical protein [Leptolyngbya sp. 7M]
MTCDDSESERQPSAQEVDVGAISVDDDRTTEETGIGKRPMEVGRDRPVGLKGQCSPNEAFIARLSRNTDASWRVDGVVRRVPEEEVGGRGQREGLDRADLQRGMHVEEVGWCEEVGIVEVVVAGEQGVEGAQGAIGGVGVAAGDVRLDPKPWLPRSVSERWWIPVRFLTCEKARLLPC